MTIDPMPQFLAQTHALAELNHLILRAVVKHIAQESGDAPKYIGELLETLETFYERLEQTIPDPGEFGRAQREEERRRLKNFALEIASELGLESSSDDVFPF